MGPIEIRVGGHTVTGYLVGVEINYPNGYSETRMKLDIMGPTEGPSVEPPKPAPLPPPPPPKPEPPRNAPRKLLLQPNTTTPPAP